MKILQYFLLLILLGAVSLGVFILTQDPNFTVQRQFILQAPKNTVYSYIADLDNWSNWSSTLKQDQEKYILKIDQLGSYVIQPEYKYPTDSLTQDILKDDKISNIKWKFNPTDDPLTTLVDFEFTSSLDLKTKLLTFFSGTPNSIASKELEKNTNALMVYFIKQYQEHHWDSKGIVMQEPIRYIALDQQKSSFVNLNVDLDKSMQTLTKFCKDNNLQVDSAAFLMVQKIQGDSIAYQMALPIKKEIFLNPDDMFFSGIIDSGSYLKNDLQGHYSHLQDHLTQYQQIAKDQQASLNPNKDLLIILQQSVWQNAKPASWQTSVMIPVVEQVQEQLPNTTTL